LISTARQCVVLSRNWGLIAGMNTEYFILYIIYTSSVAHPASKPIGNVFPSDIYMMWVYNIQ